jgi:hypothetical protein
MMRGLRHPTEARVDRKRRGRDGADLAEPRRADGSPRRPPSPVDALLELQATAGNRAVAASLDRATVQRQPARSGRNDGGALTLDSDEAIPLQSATWSLKVGVKAIYEGSERNPQIEPTKREVGNLELTRRSDAHSARLQDLLATEHERGSLRLDRPSRDGALPATTLALRDVALVAYSRGRGDDPTETLTIAVGDLQVAGMGKEASTADAVAFLQVGAGSDAWPPIPVISWEREGSPASLSSGPFQQVPMKHGPAEDRPPDLTVKIAAGMGVTHLAEALDQKRRLNFTLSPKGAGAKTEMLEALVVKVASSADGPNVVEVRFAAELARQTGRGSAGRASPRFGRVTPPL